jgi:ribulose-5-phosphate 4-epimerase/fuculose-1-phosphate aldolase
MLSNAIKDVVSADEWNVRVELAAFYRVVSQLGMTDMIYNHISVRVPGTLDAFLINPFGLDYSEITASSLVKVDLDGNVLLPSPTGYGANPAGFVIHSAVHAARHDLACVAHTHTPAGVAVASMKCGLLPLSQNAIRFMDDVGYHDYEGPSLEDGERERLAANMGTRHILILRNHGLLVGGRDIAHAYVNLHALENACRMQVETMACGQELNLPSTQSLETSRRIFAAARKAGPMKNYIGPELEWQAAKRKLDRITTEYMN